ncbi:O-antigen ligase family protein [Patescibacteria group bacterium]
MYIVERTFVWIIRTGIFLLLFTPLIVAQDLFFPFITGKAFFFRIIVEIIFGAWLSLAILNPEFRPRKSPLLWVLLAFFSIVVIATIFGADPYHSFWSNFERMEGLVTHLHIFALFVVIAHSFKSQKEWFYFFNASLAISLISAVYGLLQSMGKVPIIGGGRPFAFFGNSIYLAVYLMFHLFIASALFNKIRITWARITYAVIFLFELFVFFLAASRGAFIGLCSGVVVIALLFLFFLRSKYFRIAGIAIILCISVLAGVIIFFPESPIVQMSGIFNRLTNISLSSLKDDPRIMIWGIAWEGFKEKPVLGWGPENFIIPYAKYYNPNLFGNEAWFDRAHNMLLEWLVTTGISGFLLYIGMSLSALALLIKFVRSKKLDIITAIIIAGVFCCLYCAEYLCF